MKVNEELLPLFKALADPNRLRIVGLLGQQSYTGEQLAALVNLGASTISHHLARLYEAGLVEARAVGYYSEYSLKKEVLDQMARQMLSNEFLPAAASGIDPDAFDLKVMRDYSMPNGRLKTIPAQQKKLLAVLRQIAKAFKPGVHYSEKQVNEILKRFHDDTASLRRELVGFHLMQREGGGGDYWREEE